MNAESIAKVNETLKTLDIKGKGYVQVTERIKAFRSICPNGTIKTDIINYDEESITMMASVIDEDGRLLATGYARERQDASFINKTSYVENCETSAVGRALGMCGIGVDASMASAEEVANAIINQKKEEPKKEAPKKGKGTNVPEQPTEPKMPTKSVKEEIEEDLNRRVTKEEVQKIIAGCKENDVDVSKICKLYKKESLADLSAFQYKHIFNNWKRIKEAK